MPSTDWAIGCSTAAKQSKIYRLVVTPIIFFSFLISLAWVEFRYSVHRSHTHSLENRANASSASSVPSRMPAWLHKIIYRRQFYEYVKVTGSDDSRIGGSAHDGAHKNENENENALRHSAGATSGNKPFYYHSMQRKLLKMEAEEAFRIRGTVLCIIGLVLAGAVWAAGMAARWMMIRLWA